MSKSIFEINKKYDELLRIIEDNDGEIPLELEDQFTITLEDVESKFKNYAYIIRKIQGECKMIDDEIERLNTLKRVKLNIIKNLEKIVLVFLPKFGNKTKAGQGFKYVFDMGNIKLENRYTKPVEVSEELIKVFDKIIQLKIQGEDEKLDELLSSEELRILKDNINKYTDISYNLDSFNIIEMKKIFNAIKLEGFDIDEHFIKVKVKNAIIKEDLNNGIDIPGARINKEYAKLNIK